MPAHSHPGFLPGLPSSTQPDILPRLLHEVRQPLCGIESIAYYLEMALDGQDDAIRHQCGKIRAMVRQASWLLDDAALGAAPTVPAPQPSALNSVVFDIAERLALHDERSLILQLPALSPRVLLAESRLRRIIEHVLCFFHEVAEVDETVRILTRHSHSGCVLCISGQVQLERARELASFFDALRPGGLSAALDALGGCLEITTPPGALEIALLLPAASHD
ncbi:MAG: HAMP domain-containing histidine kinase [Bryobacteraceae bacterium]|nr:HAMP domain-containing histidine kinase [Bryobacteraceae bacterium]